MDWDRDKIALAVRRWAQEHQGPPRTRDWAAPGPAWPSYRIVVRVFGTWNAAIVAAGFTPRCQRRGNQAPERASEHGAGPPVERLQAKGLSEREISSVCRLLASKRCEGRRLRVPSVPGSSTRTLLLARLTVA